jgi:uncharacterized membrane protein SpoIIM required for sporulation
VSRTRPAASIPQDEAQQLEALLVRVERGARLSFDEVRSLARLYRLQAARLSSLRQRGEDVEAMRYLNALCARAYSFVHAQPVRPDRSRWFWLAELPGALARTWHLQCIAAALLAAGAFMGVRAVAIDPATLPQLVGMYPGRSLERLAESAAERQAFLQRKPVDVDENSIFGASLFANNTRVGVLAFAAGLLLALPTVLLVLYNGLTLGGFSAIFLGTAESSTFLAWIIPHGIPELLAIVLCASGGLAMGLSVLAPSRAGRAASLRAASSDAVALVLAALPLFVVAALIESFVRQSLLSTAARFAVAGVVTLILLAYVALVTRLARRRRRVDTSFLGASAVQSARRSAR